MKRVAVIIAIIALAAMFINTGTAHALSYSLRLNFGKFSYNGGDGEFRSPWAVATDSNDRIIVADAFNHRIQVFDSNGNFITKFGSISGFSGSGDGQLNYPRGVATDSNDRIIVAELGNNRVQAFDSSGNFLFKIGGPVSSNDGEFRGPSGVATDSNDRIIVTDTANNRIQVFDSSGNFLFKFGSLGTGNGEFYQPTGVATDSNDRIIVADIGNNRIQVFDSSGNFLFKFGSFGSGDGKFNSPWAVATDNNDRIIVVDTDNDRIQVFDKDGNFLSKFGLHGRGDGQFYFPYGVATDNNDRIIVADTSNHRIQVFSVTTSSLTLLEGTESSDGRIDLGEVITAQAVTDDPNAKEAVFRWLDPNGNEVRRATVQFSSPAKDRFTPPWVGTWTVIADFGNGNTVTETLNVGFFVLPEVPIGAIGIVASIFSVFAIMIMMRRK